MKRPPRLYRPEPAAPVERWQGADYIVRLSTTKTGRPAAHYWQRELRCWLAMPRVDAYRLLAEGRATTEPTA